MNAINNKILPIISNNPTTKTILNHRETQQNYVVVKRRVKHVLIEYIIFSLDSECSSYHCNFKTKSRPKLVKLVKFFLCHYELR